MAGESRMDFAVLWILLLFGDAGPTTIRYDSFSSMSASPLATQIEPTVSVVASAQTLQRSHQSTVGINRRQIVTQLVDLLQKLAVDIHERRRKRNETLFEAYWPGGDWVYKRTQRTRRKRITQPTEPTTKFNGTTESHTTPTTTTTEKGQNTTTPPSTYVNYVCQHPCPFLFENYGTICAHRFNGLEYEVKEFIDACDMVMENCVFHATTRAKPRDHLKNYRGQWTIILRGPCYLLMSTMAGPPTNVTEILERMKNLVTFDMLQFRTRI